MSKITFGYIVGGEDKHYNNLLRSLESLERIEQPHEVVILDADSRLEADEDKPNVRIIPFPVDEAKGEGWFKPHYWQMSCLLYTSPSPRDKRQSRMPSSA